MGKIIATFTAVSLSALAIGTRVAPNEAVFWLASGNVAYEAVRLVLAAVIFGQVVTKPPRKMWFRALAGALALAVGIWTTVETLNYTMMATDSILFMLASIAVALTALEVDTPALQASHQRTATT